MTHFRPINRFKMVIFLTPVAPAAPWMNSLIFLLDTTRSLWSDQVGLGVEVVVGGAAGA